MSGTGGSIVVEFRAGRADQEPGSSLIQAMRDEMAALYDDLDIDAPDMPPAGPTEFLPPSGDFLLGIHSTGDAACCGGVKRLPDGTCEFKRIYVRPEFRRHGMARLLLSALEARAREMGYEVARLDTGSRQPHAERLFRDAGYEPTGNFNDNPVATFFGEKRL